MKRREFIVSSSVAGVGSVFGSSCNNSSSETTKGSFTNEHLAPFELDEISIGLLQEKMKSGKLSAEKVVQLYLERIKQIDQNGISLNAVIEINPDAIAIAVQLDQERKNGKLRGAMHGIPVLIKDNIDTSDKMQTTAGSLAMQGHISPADAFVVRKLREAGAVILGKTNLSEWANFRSKHSSSGWSSRGGQTKNPYILDHNPCGSSSGSGVAVAANLCTVAVGTETDGSVTCPASVNGIVGLKPTVGLVSRSGIIPISATQDTAGPMGRTVTDVAVLLGAMVGVDADDAVTKESEGRFETDYTKYLNVNGLKGKRIGIEKNPQGNNQFIHALWLKTLEVLKKQGAEIVETEYLAEINKLGDAEYDLLKFEFKDGLNKYLLASGSKMKSLTDVIAFNNANEDKTMPYFRQEILEASNKMEGIGSRKYEEAFEKCHLGSKKIIDEVLSKNNLDAICGITMGPACSIDIIYGDRWGDVSLTMPAAVTGYPHITVPGGLIYDLPVGISFFGPAYSERTLFSMAYAYEQATKNRIAPAFSKSFLK